VAIRRLTGGERARRILAFREELDEVVREGGVAADDPTLAAIASHHDRVLADLAAREDVDLTRDEARLSAGMRLATLLGAAALSTAWGLLVSSVWDDLGTASRLAVVWLPALAMAGMVPWAARREQSGYVANIVATVAAIGLVVAGFATLDTLDRPEARWPLLLAGGYAMFAAYHHRLVLPLLLGIVGVGAWLWSLDALVFGDPVTRAFRHAEPVVLLGAVAVAIGRSPLADPPGFRRAWTILGMTALAMSLLYLGLNADGSWFGSGRAVEGMYQVIGAATFVGLAWFGLARDDLTLARGAAAALVVFLFFRLMDWFWDAIPNWLFFLMVGALALGALLVLSRVRSRRRSAALPR
jgi:hypothetical protein